MCVLCLCVCACLTGHDFWFLKQCFTECLPTLLLWFDYKMSDRITGCGKLSSQLLLLFSEVLESSRVWNLTVGSGLLGINLGSMPCTRLSFVCYEESRLWHMLLWPHAMPHSWPRVSRCKDPHWNLWNYESKSALFSLSHLCWYFITVSETDWCFSISRFNCL